MSNFLGVELGVHPRITRTPSLFSQFRFGGLSRSSKKSVKESVSFSLWVGTVFIPSFHIGSQSLRDVRCTDLCPYIVEECSLPSFVHPCHYVRWESDIRVRECIEHVSSTSYLLNLIIHLLNSNWYWSVYI